MSTSRQTELTAWCNFLSTLAVAEGGAAKQAQWAAEVFDRQDANLRPLSAHYQQLAAEELAHENIAREIGHLLAAQLNSPHLTPQATASEHAIYDGDRGSFTDERAVLLERLAVIHLVFEPYLFGYAVDLYRLADSCDDRSLATAIKSHLGQILQDETRHVKLGKDVVKTLLLANDDKQLLHGVHQTMQRHRRFLDRGVRRIFSGNEQLRALSAGIINRCHHSVRYASAYSFA